MLHIIVTIERYIKNITVNGKDYQLTDMVALCELVCFTDPFLLNYSPQLSPYIPLRTNYIAVTMLFAVWSLSSCP